MNEWLRLAPRLALRNVMRQARRSLLTAAAVVVGLALLMMSRTLADGAHEQWIEGGVRLGSGHVAIQHPAFLRTASLDDRLGPTAVRAARSALERPEIAKRLRASAPRLALSGLASSAAGARPVRITGVDPVREAEFSTLDEHTREGRYLQPDDSLAAYVGARLAELLDLELGSRAVLTAQDASGAITGQLVRIVGIYRTGMPDVDAGIVHIPLTTAREWLELGGSLTSIALLLDSSRSVEPVQRSLRDALRGSIPAGSTAVLSWARTMPELQAGVRLDDFGDYVFHAILLAIVAIAIVNTVLMSVLQRTREFGVLQALGLTGASAALLVFIEGVLLTLASGVVGIVLGLAVTWLLWRDGFDLSVFWSEDLTVSGVIIDPVLVPEFRLFHVVMGMAFVLAIGIVASIYPAYRATRIDVAEAMKFER